MLKNKEGNNVVDVKNGQGGASGVESVNTTGSSSNLVQPPRDLSSISSQISHSPGGNNLGKFGNDPRSNDRGRNSGVAVPPCSSSSSFVPNEFRSDNSSSGGHFPSPSQFPFFGGNSNLIGGPTLFPGGSAPNNNLLMGMNDHRNRNLPLFSNSYPNSLPGLTTAGQIGDQSGGQSGPFGGFSGHSGAFGGQLGPFLGYSGQTAAFGVQSGPVGGHSGLNGAFGGQSGVFGGYSGQNGVLGGQSVPFGGHYGQSGSLGGQYNGQASHINQGGGHSSGTNRDSGLLPIPLVVTGKLGTVTTPNSVSDGNIAGHSGGNVNGNTAGNTGVDVGGNIRQNNEGETPGDMQGKAGGHTGVETGRSSNTVGNTQGDNGGNLGGNTHGNTGGNTSPDPGTNTGGNWLEGLRRLIATGVPSDNSSVGTSAASPENNAGRTGGAGSVGTFAASPDDSYSGAQGQGGGQTQHGGINQLPHNYYIRPGRRSLAGRYSNAGATGTFATSDGGTTASEVNGFPSILPTMPTSASAFAPGPPPTWARAPNVVQGSLTDLLRGSGVSAITQGSNITGTTALASGLPSSGLLGNCV
jgi:hypothetical protein